MIDAGKSVPSLISTVIYLLFKDAIKGLVSSEDESYQKWLTFNFAYADAIISRDHWDQPWAS